MAPLRDICGRSSDERGPFVQGETSGRCAPSQIRWALIVAACGSPAACSSAGGGSLPVEADSPTVALGGSAAIVTTEVAATPADAGPKPQPWPACTPQMFDHAPGNHDRYAFQQETDDRYGYRDGAGKVVVPPRFFFAYEFSPEGIAAAIGEAGPQYIKPDGQIVAQAFVSDNGPDYFTEGRARVVEAGKVGFIDQEGQVVVEPRFDHATAFCHARSVVCSGCSEQAEGEHRRFVGGHWGLIDRSGREVVPLRYDALVGLDGEQVTFSLDGNQVTLDLDGRPLAQPAP